MGVAPEIIVEGRNGWICPPIDKVCFSKKIDLILQEPKVYSDVKKYMSENPYTHNYADRFEYDKVLLRNMENSLDIKEKQN